MFKIKIKQFRKIKGMSQQELADNVGVSRSYISKIENTEFENVNVGVLKKIIYCLEIKPCEIFSFCDTCKFRKCKHTKLKKPTK